MTELSFEKNNHHNADQACLWYWLNVYVPIPKLTKKSISVTIKEYKTSMVLHTTMLHIYQCGLKCGTPGDVSGDIISTFCLVFI